MNRFPVLLALLFLVSLALAQKPLTIGSMNASLVISGDIPSSQKIYIPQQTEMQKVIGPGAYKQDKYGNRYILAKGKFNISYKLVVNSKIPIVRDEPLGWNEGNNSKYLESTSLINSDNPVIKSIATQVTKGKKTKLEAISALALWVNSYLKYDSKYADKYLSAVETLENKRGVCDEFTNLYAALARSIGIPTRPVVGLVYTGTRWQLHAWAESKVSGQWIPVDPTFAEMGQIDATHIVLYRGPTYPFLVSPEARLVYDVRDPSFSDYNLNMEIKPLVPETLGPRQVFNVTLELKNNENFILTPTYLLQTMQGFNVIDNPRQTLVLYPGDEKNITWKIVAPYGERKNYFLGLVGPGLDELYEVNITNRKPEMVSGIKLGTVFYKVEDENLVFECVVKNKGNTYIDSASLSISSQELGGIVKEFNLDVGEEKKLKMVLPSVPGKHLVRISLSYGNQSSSDYIMVDIQEPGKKEKDLLSSFIQYLSQSSTRIFLSLLVLALGVVLVIFLSVHTPRKLPLKEKKKWHDLLKIERR